MNKQCCNTPVKTGRKNGEYAMWCETCGKKGKGRTEKAALDNFDKSKPSSAIQPTAIMVMPKNKTELPAYINGHANELTNLVSPILPEKKAMIRLISGNFRYAQNAKQLVKCWNSEAGIESVIHAIEDAIELGAELGKMGDIVPYGEVCEFIPAVEAYEFALTNGNSPPFMWINIEPIYSNDKVEVGRKDGNFFLDFEKMGFPRGDVVQVAVYGESAKTGYIVGELYDAKRLLDKMATHSSSYKYYLQDKRSFEALRNEGKTGIMNGREYFEKELPKKGGNGTWKKKVFLDELSNPYAGADQPEMLRKAAGKSFLRKYARVRNSEAAMNEMKGTDDQDLESIANDALSQAMGQFDNAPLDDVVDYEVVGEEMEHTTDTPADTDTATTDQPELNIH